ncbi:hypothetical protein MKW94_009403 [Papaver nudicaule]|uniref:F-box associated beta-propeller type 3 domain-containing protein n=1 Tax=Papaver nudicaule TaxID=74823 RepID=A0AA41VDQ0_PAPNU|nr:hypothetical protein [Papaver nudicaule]
MKKISPNIRFMEGIRAPRCFSSTVIDTADHRSNEAVVGDDSEKLPKDWSKVTEETRYEWVKGAAQSEMISIPDIDQRWEDWVFSTNKLWKEKNEEEQRRELDMRWIHLRDLLHRQGYDTSHHRLLMSMKITEPYWLSNSKSEETIIEFKVGAPDKGLVSINSLVLEHGPYHPDSLPRQTVRGLICFTSNKNDAFLIYNPITGERTPWIGTNKQGSIAFGFNIQSHEHNVICVSGDLDSDQVVDVFTVGKNTWRKSDAIPPIAIGCARPFYVDGCLYWRFRETKKDEPEKILRFDIATEKFRIIPIHEYVSRFSQTVELTEIDGCIAVLDWLWNGKICLWKIHEKADGNIKWTGEFINMPPHWYRKPDYSIEALTGTNLIFLQYECSDSIFYYNRNTKESIRFPVSPDLDLARDDWERIMQV